MCPFYALYNNVLRILLKDLLFRCCDDDDGRLWFAPGACCFCALSAFASVLLIPERQKSSKLGA